MNNLSQIWNLFNKNLRISFFFLLIFIFLSMILEIFSITLLIPIISIIYDEGLLVQEYALKYNINFPKEFLNINFIFLTFIIFYLFKSLFLIFVSHYKTKFIFSFFNVLLNRLFSSYIYENYLFHAENKTPELLRNLMGEIHKVSVGYTGAIINITMETIIILGTLFLLIFFQPSFIIFVIFVVGFILYLVLYFLKKTISRIAINQQNFSYLNLKYAIEALGGIKEIKVANAENKILEDFNKNSINLQRTNYLIGFFNSLPRIVIEFGIVLIVFIILYLFKLLSYPNSIIFANLALLIGVFVRIFPSLNKISVSFININFYKESVNLLYEKIKYKKNKLSFIKNKLKKINFKKEITLKNISFSYPNNNKNILNNLSLIIKKGEKIGIMGETGSGKSTLVNILIGLFSPNISGLVEVDGKNIQKNISGWYSNIGYVPQYVFLNNDTIKNNIAFNQNLNEIIEDRVLQAIKESQLENFLTSKNNNLNFVISDDGKNLSGGQRQRVGIARALYKNPEILIFDESTNSLDKKTEDDFIKSINNIKNKTIIMISHNKNTLKYCDKIFYLNEGKLLKI